MYILTEHTHLIEQLNHSVKEVGAKLFKELTPYQERLIIPAQTDLAKTDLLDGKLLLLTEGMVVCSNEGRKLFFWDEGDILGLDALFAPPPYSIWSECAVMCSSYRLSELLAVVNANDTLQKLWLKLLGCQMQLLTALSAALVRGEISTEPSIEMFHAGEVILEEGGTADKVYSLIKGHAEVFVGGVKVGEILPDELFGALAALTETPRTASVIADGDCMVLALPKEHFVELLGGRPATVQQLVKDMARAIVALNEKVVGLQGQIT